MQAVRCDTPRFATRPAYAPLQEVLGKASATATATTDLIDKTFLQSPTLAGIGRLFSDADDDSIDSEEGSDNEREAQEVGTACAAFPHHPLSLHVPEPEESEESVDSSSSNQFLNDEDPSEQSHTSEQISRYAGHPLGVDELELQEQRVAEHKAMLVAEYMGELRSRERWGLAESRARAKILVSEAYFKELKHVMEMDEHLHEQEVMGAEPRPVRRFKANHRFRDAAFQAHEPALLQRPDLLRRVLETRKATLVQRWRQLGRQVSDEMSECDNFQNVIRNLSTMKIFLEGQQSPTYCFNQERTRRQQGKILQTVMQRNDGPFLKDVLPRGEPL